jgi:glutamate-1-semialdehyde 2,1-aminomutase
LPHRLEVEVAERLIELVPCAEQVRFLRTGAEATAAAVRIARTATARAHVIGSGYFGWLDWCSEAAGVPEGVRRDFTSVPFDDVAAMQAAVAAHAGDLAAIIVEPLVHEIASVAWLTAIRAECDRVGAVMILDEIKTAFRIRTGGVQEFLHVRPDLTTLGKAMANGFPLAAVVGRAEIMGAAAGTWISSTAAAESTGLAAAKAVCDWHDRVDVPARLAAIGTGLRDMVAASLEESPWTGVTAHGPPAMWRLEAEIPERLDAFVAGAAREGVLFKRGAYQFAALAHDDKATDTVHSALAVVVRSLVPGPRRTDR